MGTNQDWTAIIVGGAGAMGRWAVRAIAELASVSTLLVADIDEAKAQRVVDEVGGPCRAVALDATDADAMREAFAGCDVVLNTMGPFSVFARRILKTAIECGCDYLDIDDDWESTLEAFERDEAARKRDCASSRESGAAPATRTCAPCSRHAAWTPSTRSSPGGPCVARSPWTSRTTHPAQPARAPRSGTG